ncbi:MAG: hypothetical protein FJW27_17430 [Acidimicrobiia bacterium]|nr:hypothetical protein [Acidimicrobiia bacterium]
MLKKILIGAALALILLFAGVFFLAKSALTGEAVRIALAAQVEKAIGQPVSIGALHVSVMPRLTLTLGNVTLGKPARMTVDDLRVGTDFGALFSRRIEHASLHLTGARIELPLPTLTIASSPAPPSDAEPSKPPVELVSIDEIVLSDVQVVSGGRMLRVDIELVPKGTTAVQIRRIALAADDTTINVTGQITDVNGPVGELAIKAGKLNLDRLLAFVNDFTAGAGLASVAGGSGATPSSSTASGPPSTMDVVLSLDAESATMGGLTLSALSGKATVTGHGLTLNPVSFGIFGGEYQGSLGLTPGQTLRFKGSATLSNIDVVAAARFGGSPDTITGRLSGKLDFADSGSDPSVVMKTTTGRARVDITDGEIRNLGLVSAVVAATSMRAGALSQAVSTAKSGSKDEPFGRLGATLDSRGGNISTNDLSFESRDLLLNAQGVIGLIASTADLKGRVQLSDELSRQAGSDLVKFTQDQGRVTLPVTVSGSLDSPHARVDVGNMAKRALQNAVNEQTDRAKTQATEAVKKRLGGLFGR